jgi:hypothetical protein
MESHQQPEEKDRQQIAHRRPWWGGAWATFAGVPSTAPYTFLFLAALAVTGGSGCRVREQSEGQYEFTATSVEKDDCLLSPGATPFLGADFTSTGNIVRIGTDFHGVTLAGAYFNRALGDSSPERFYADGTAQNVQADVGTLHCDLDQAVLHMEATTDTAGQFHGVLRYRYEARQPPGCLCESWVTFQALHQ